MKYKICLSSLTIEPDMQGSIVLAGEWCRNKASEKYLYERNKEFQIAPPRFLSRDEYCTESEECFRLYEKYSQILAQELNRIHGTNYSLRYWETILNRFLYPLISTVIDKHSVLQNLKKRWPDASVDLIDYKLQLINPHRIVSFGGSRLLHLLIYSVIAVKANLFSFQFMSLNKLKKSLSDQGDGKKDSPLNVKNNIKNSWWFLEKIKSFFRALILLELPFILVKYINPKIIPLGRQYLSYQDYNLLMIFSGALPFFYKAKNFNTSKFKSCDIDKRYLLRFPVSESSTEESLQECLRVFLPTIFLENYNLTRDMVKKSLPKSPCIILNSQQHEGGEFIDFFIAHAIEELKSKHIMVCHGGCYGVMDVSIQERVWARISDVYALWTEPPNILGEKLIKLPSLRFNKWLKPQKNKSSKKDILIFLTGCYPQRYSYNSIFPYTIDEQYDEWQIRFLKNIEKKLYPRIIVRDFHRSSDVGLGKIKNWIEAQEGISVKTNISMEDALNSSRVAIQTVPQTTYLETLIANHPTLCYWNPDVNLIRKDLNKYFALLETVGVIHYSPESAAKKLNEIYEDPWSWWGSEEVQDAVKKFRKHVCYTSTNAITEWSSFLRKFNIEGR